MPRYVVRCPNGHFLTELTISVHIPTSVAVRDRGYCARCPRDARRFEGQPERQAVMVLRQDAPRAS